MDIIHIISCLGQGDVIYMP